VNFWGHIYIKPANYPHIFSLHSEEISLASGRRKNGKTDDYSVVIVNVNIP
jgi:hypothetical protein